VNETTSNKLASHKLTSHKLTSHWHKPAALLARGTPAGRPRYPQNVG
jgi:hypothetical protein